MINWFIICSDLFVINTFSGLNTKILIHWITLHNWNIENKRIKSLDNLSNSLSDEWKLKQTFFCYCYCFRVCYGNDGKSIKKSAEVKPERLVGFDSRGYQRQKLNTPSIQTRKFRKSKKNNLYEPTIRLKWHFNFLTSDYRISSKCSELSGKKYNLTRLQNVWKPQGSKWIASVVNASHEQIYPNLYYFASS